MKVFAPDAPAPVGRLIDEASTIGPLLLDLIVAGLAFAETALFLDLVVPGEAGMVVAGAAGRRSGAPLGVLIAAGSAGAVLGDSCSYVLGRWVGAHRLDRWPRIARSVRARLDRAQGFFARRGGAAVFLGRWVGALRAVVPFVAGAARMSYGRFLVWNVLASVAWVSTILTLGWVLGDAVAAVVDRVGLVVSAVVVLTLVVWFVLRWRRARVAARGPAPT